MVHGGAGGHFRQIDRLSLTLSREFGRQWRGLVPGLLPGGHLPSQRDGAPKQAGKMSALRNNRPYPARPGGWENCHRADSEIYPMVDSLYQG